MLSTATVVLTASAGVAVVGLFGMNIGISLYNTSTDKLVNLPEDIMDGSRILIFMDTKNLNFFAEIFWYPAINKPVGVVHWLNHSPEADNVDWVVILDADQIVRGPIIPWELGAEKGKPVAAYYGYLKGCDNILAQLHTAHPEFCDKVGGLLAMHIDDLRALAPLWLSKTEEVRQDKSHWSTNITGDIYGMGWISEMYGYSFGAAEERGFSVILSDMYPVVSGITTKDAAISCELGMRTLSLAFGKITIKYSNYSATIEKFQSSTNPDPDEDGVLRCAAVVLCQCVVLCGAISICEGIWRPTWKCNSLVQERLQSTKKTSEDYRGSSICSR